jgi:hypothetical protein
MSSTGPMICTTLPVFTASATAIAVSLNQNLASNPPHLWVGPG